MTELAAEQATWRTEIPLAGWCWIVLGPVGAAIAGNRLGALGNERGPDDTWGHHATDPRALVLTVIAFVLVALVARGYYRPLEGGVDWIGTRGGRRRVRIRFGEIVAVARERFTAYHTGKAATPTGTTSAAFRVTTADERTVLAVKDNFGDQWELFYRVFDAAVAAAATNALAGIAAGSPYVRTSVTLHADRLVFPDGTAVPLGEIARIDEPREHDGKSPLLRLVATGPSGRPLADVPDDPVLLAAIARVRPGIVAVPLI